MSTQFTGEQILGAFKLTFKLFVSISSSWIANKYPSTWEEKGAWNNHLLVLPLSTLFAFFLVFSK